MPRPTNKNDLITLSEENFAKLMKTADSMSEAALGNVTKTFVMCSYTCMSGIS